MMTFTQRENLEALMKRLGQEIDDLGDAADRCENEHAGQMLRIVRDNCLSSMCLINAVLDAEEYT